MLFPACMLQTPQEELANDSTGSRRTLETEIAGMESRQLPSTSGELKPPTLISSLRRAIAASAECEVSQTVSKMWEILSSTGFDDVDEGKLGMIVKGEQLERGMRRIF